MKECYSKVLTANDVGETGGHQGGICVPRNNRELLDFFPRLDEGVVNPEAWIGCIDPDGKRWRMRYVYYNGKLHDTSTRNEYRITYMTKFFKKWNAQKESTVVFTETESEGVYMIRIDPPATSENKQSDLQLKDDPPVIVLAAKGWNRIH